MMGRRTHPPGRAWQPERKGAATPSPPEDRAAAVLRQQAEALYQKKPGLANDLSLSDLQHLVVELGVHQVELELQKEELQRIRQELEDRLVYIDLFDFAPVGYFTMGADGTILQVNVTGKQLLNERDSRRVVGARFGVFVSDATRHVFNGFLKRVFSTRSIQRCEVGLQKENEAPLWVHIEGVVAENGAECRITVHDISARRQMEKELKEMNSRLEERVAERTQELQRANRALAEAHETERRTLALELHDELGQILNRVKISLDVAPMLGTEELKKELSLASGLVQDLIHRVRRMALELRPSMLDDLGLLPTLLWLFKNYESQSRERVWFEHTGIDRRFQSEVEIAAYRIVQEALTNLIRYGGKKEVRVKLWVDEARMHVLISDQGGGFDLEAAMNKKSSTGLSGMQERAAQIGGRLTIESVRGQGTIIRAVLPLKTPGQE